MPGNSLLKCLVLHQHGEVSDKGRLNFIHKLNMTPVAALQRCFQLESQLKSVRMIDDATSNSKWISVPQI